MHGSMVEKMLAECLEDENIGVFDIHRVFYGENNKYYENDMDPLEKSRMVALIDQKRQVQARQEFNRTREK